MVFRRSSAVEQLTVNQLVVGSIPTAGATFSQENQYVSFWMPKIMLKKKTGGRKSSIPVKIMLLFQLRILIKTY